MRDLIFPVLFHSATGTSIQSQGSGHGHFRPRWPKDQVISDHKLLPAHSNTNQKFEVGGGGQMKFKDLSWTLSRRLTAIHHSVSPVLLCIWRYCLTFPKKFLPTRLSPYLSPRTCAITNILDGRCAHLADDALASVFLHLAVIKVKRKASEELDVCHLQGVQTLFAFPFRTLKENPKQTNKKNNPTFESSGDALGQDSPKEICHLVLIEFWLFKSFRRLYLTYWASSIEIAGVPFQ